MQGRGRGRGRRWRQQGCSRRAVRILKPTLLLLLHHGPAHGYTLIDDLGRYGLGDVNPSVVYRALRDMEEKGWVASSWDEEETKGPPRRVYNLTALGDEVLAWWMQDLRETQQVIDRILTTHTRHMEEGEGDYH
ncbi:MAG: helix-turn-helix transcriptional regulator [Anaerolineae bacterium]